MTRDADRIRKHIRAENGGRELDVPARRRADPSSVRPAREDLVDLPHQCPGPGYVGQGKVDADRLDPGLHGVVGHRIGEQGPEPLGVGKRLAGGGDITPVRGDAGLRDPDRDLV